MSKENRESIELPEDKLFITGEITPFKAYIPMEEVILYEMLYLVDEVLNSNMLHMWT